MSDDDATSAPPDATPPDRSRPISDALLTALTTDQFVLQSAASTTVSEAVGRSTLFTSTLSSSLVALGFATSLPSVLVPLLAITIPLNFVLGVFTVVRLVDTAVSNVAYLTQIARIRKRYAELDPEGPAFFPASGDAFQLAVGSLTTTSRLAGFFTAASMVATVTSLVAGLGVGLLIVRFSPGLLWLAALPGAVAFLAGMVAFVRYQTFRARAATI